MEKIQYITDNSLRIVDDAHPLLRIVEPEQEEYGPHIHEVGYKPGGHSELMEAAMLGSEGKLLLTHEDLQNPSRLMQIHPIWRDELVKGNALELSSTGHMEILHPKLVVVYEKKK